MLEVRDRVVCRELQLPLARDGTILLPEGVRMENIVSIYDGSRRLRLLPHRLPRVRQSSGGGAVTVIYEEPYRPIRQTRYNGAVTVDAAQDRLYINDCEFIAGDTLSLTVGSSTKEHIPLLSVGYDPDRLRGYSLTVAQGALLELDGAESESASIRREVTDKTVCDAPYDTMYVDYLLAKIAQYQRDMAAYSVNIAAFDSVLSRYKSWLTAHMPHEKNIFRNLW